MILAYIFDLNAKTVLTKPKINLILAIFFFTEMSSKYINLKKKNI